MRGVSSVSGRVKDGLDFGTATVGFADSGVGGQVLLLSMEFRTVRRRQ